MVLTNAERQALHRSGCRTVPRASRRSPNPGFSTRREAARHFHAWIDLLHPQIDHPRSGKEEEKERVFVEP